MQIEKASIDEAKIIANIISESNIPVAQQFGINEENNAKHPSFYTEEWVRSDFDRGEEYFILKIRGLPVGCVAFEKARETTGYLNRLSVLPKYQRKGAGKSLVEHIFKYSKSKNISKISIGIIADHTALKNWYLKLGFQEKGKKVFEHLPFDVMFLVYSL